MTREQKEKRALLHFINTRKIPRKLAYTLVMQKPVMRKYYNQAENIHDNYYHDSICGLVHVYLKDPKRDKKK